MCKYVIPEPRKHRVIKCRKCGNKSYSEAMPRRAVVSTNPTQLQAQIPFIVGEDVKRYAVTTTRFLELNVDGLNYKNLQTYSTERLLVRENGNRDKRNYHAYTSCDKPGGVSCHSETRCGSCVPTIFTRSTVVACNFRIPSQKGWRKRMAVSPLHYTYSLATTSNPNTQERYKTMEIRR